MYFKKSYDLIISSTQGTTGIVRIMEIPGEVVHVKNHKKDHTCVYASILMIFFLIHDKSYMINHKVYFSLKAFNVPLTAELG